MFSPAPPDVVIIVAIKERGEHQNNFHNEQSRNRVGQAVTLIYMYSIGSHLSKQQLGPEGVRITKLRLHVAFKPVPKPVSIEPAWNPQV